MRSIYLTILTMLLILIWGGLASADVPEYLNYQGYLTDDQGAPVADGDYAIYFRIYDSAEDGTILWSSDRMSVTVEDGLFAVPLGPFWYGLFADGGERWLGITVGGDTEISPRTRFMAVPYAVYAHSAAPAVPIMWSGGCSSHGQTPGLLTYCTDVVDFNTAEDYLSVSSGGTFTVLQAGFYRINAWTANLSALGAHVTILKNGSPIMENSYNTQDEWTTISADITWYFGSGDTFVVQYYSNSGDYNYYSYDGNCCYSRLQVTYVGPIN